MASIWGIGLTVAQIANLCRHPSNDAAIVLAVTSFALIAATVWAKHHQG